MFVPEQFLYEKLCIEAIKSNPSAIKFVPKNIITYELCLLVAKNIKYIGMTIHSVPKIYLTTEIFLETLKNIKQYSHPMLKIIPKEFRDIQVCLEAIKIDFNEIRYVPHHIINDNDFISEIIKINLVKSFPYLPDKLKTFELCKQLVSLNNKSLNYIPINIINDNLEFFQQFL